MSRGDPLMLKVVNPLPDSTGILAPNRNLLPSLPERCPLHLPRLVVQLLSLPAISPSPLIPIDINRPHLLPRVDQRGVLLVETVPVVFLALPLDHEFVEDAFDVRRDGGNDSNPIPLALTAGGAVSIRITRRKSPNLTHRLHIMPRLIDRPLGEGRAGLPTDDIEVAREPLPQKGIGAEHQHNSVVLLFDLVSNLIAVKTSRSA